MKMSEEIKVYVMRAPFETDKPMLYLQDYSEGRFGGYCWTAKKENAIQLSFEEAYKIKNNFCAFGDTKENLLLVCVDDIKDDSYSYEYISPLLKR